MSLVFGVIVRTLRGDGGPGAVQGAFCDRSALLVALLARPIKKIALELLTIAEPEFGFRNRECRVVGEGFLPRLARRLRNRTANGADGNYRHSSRNCRSHDQPRDAAVPHDCLPSFELLQTMGDRVSKHVTSITG